MKQLEERIQAECFKWAWNTFPDLRRQLFHIPNGGRRSKVEAMRFQAMGVIAGVPDLCLVVNDGHSYFFEIKGSSTAVSPAQKKLHALWKSKNIPIVVCRTLQEFQHEFLKVLSYEGIKH